MFTVLGMDPGTNNYAYSVVQVGLKPFRYNILEHGMLQHPVKELAGLEVGEQIQKFQREIAAIKRKYRPDFACAERYMTRGHGGTTIEAISIMLGVVATMFKSEVCFLTAATWKNAFNKQQSLDGLYEDLRAYGMVAHRLDAVCIGLYGASYALDIPHFQMLPNMKQFKKRLLDAL